jgi:hypothetical protein
MNEKKRRLMTRPHAVELGLQVMLPGQKERAGPDSETGGVADHQASDTVRDQAKCLCRIDPDGYALLYQMDPMRCVVDFSEGSSSPGHHELQLFGAKTAPKLCRLIN